MCHTLLLKKKQGHCAAWLSDAIRPALGRALSGVGYGVSTARKGCEPSEPNLHAPRLARDRAARRERACFCTHTLLPDEGQGRQGGEDDREYDRGLSENHGERCASNRAADKERADSRQRSGLIRSFGVVRQEHDGEEGLSERTQIRCGHDGSVGPLADALKARALDSGGKRDGENRYRLRERGRQHSNDRQDYHFNAKADSGGPHLVVRETPLVQPLRREDAREKSQHRRNVTQRLPPFTLSGEDNEQDDIASLGVREHVPVGDPSIGVEKASAGAQQSGETQRAIHEGRPKSRSGGAAELHSSALAERARGRAPLAFPSATQGSPEKVARKVG